MIKYYVGELSLISDADTASLRFRFRGAGPLLRNLAVHEKIVRVVPSPTRTPPERLVHALREAAARGQTFLCMIEWYPSDYTFGALRYHAAGREEEFDAQDAQRAPCILLSTPPVDPALLTPPKVEELKKAATLSSTQTPAASGNQRKQEGPKPLDELGWR